MAYVPHSFYHRMGTGEFNLSTDTLKLALYPAAAAATWAEANAQDTDDLNYTATGESSGSGYTAGGATLTSVTWTEDDTGNKAVLDAADVVFSGASLTYRFAVIYDHTATNKAVISITDFGSDQVVSSTDLTFTMPAGGILTIG